MDVQIQHSLGILMNDERAMACLASALAPRLAPFLPSGNVHVGVGFYQDNEVLLHKRPENSGGALLELLAPLRSSCLMSHVDTGAGVRFRAETQQPHRYRDWLFAFSGDLQRRTDPEQQVLAIPSHIAANMQVASGPEILFHLFLAFLFGAGRLQGLQWEPQTVRKALTGALSHLSSYFAPPAGQPNYRYSLLATNGECFVGATHGRTFGLLRLDGIDHCPRCSNMTVSRDQDIRIIGHPHIHATVVTDLVVDAEGRLPVDWVPLADPGLFILDPQGQVSQFDLDLRPLPDKHG